MANVYLFSLLFGVLEMDTLPNPNSYPFKTYAYSHELRSWTVIGVAHNPKVKGNLAWYATGYKALPAKIKAYALLLGLPTS